MDVSTRLRLSLGPVRPFLFGKLRFALQRRRLARRWAASRHLRGPLPTFHVINTSIPSTTWISRHAHRVADFVDTMIDNGTVRVMGSTCIIRGTGDGLRLPWTEHAAAGAVWPEDAWYRSADVWLPRIDNLHGVSRTTADGRIDADVRIPHEFSRAHQWSALALDARLRPEYAQRNADCFRAQLEDFCSRFPPGYGLPWAFPMGVGMRCCIALLAWNDFRQSGIVDAALEQRVVEFAVDHVRFVLAHLEWAGGMRTSHYTGNLVGPLAAGLLLRGNDTDKWYEFAAHELDAECCIQFGEDGMNIEASTGYHRHMVDLFVMIFALRQHDRGDLPENVAKRIHSAVNALSVLESVGMPLIGDNDDGMLVKVVNYVADTSLLFDTAVRAGLWYPKDHSDAFHVAFPVFGLDVVRTPSFSATLRCGGVGQFGKGGHAHNDRNAITFRVGDQDVVIDSGCYTYTGNPVRRNRDRSTAQHATLVLEGREQLAWPNDNGEGLFWMMPDRTKSSVVERSSSSWVGRHEGYGAPHIRSIIIDEQRLHGEDVYRTSPGERAWLHFPIAPNIDVRVVDSVAEFSVRGQRGVLATLHVVEGGSIHVSPSVCAPAYGESSDNVIVVVDVTADVTRWTLSVA